MADDKRQRLRIGLDPAWEAADAAERVEPVELRIRGKLAALAEVAAAERAGLGSCVWSVALAPSEAEFWQPACRGADRLFQFNDGGPAENDFGFCPFCGRRLEVPGPVLPELEA